MSYEKIFQSFVPLMYQAKVCSVTFVIFVVGLAGCETTDHHLRSVEAIASRHELERLNLPDQMRSVCEETMKVRLAMYEATKARQKAKLDQLEETRKGLLAKTRTLSKKVARGSEEASSEYEQTRKSLQWADVQRARILNARKSADKIADASFSEIAKTMSDHNTRIDMICRVTDSGRVDCVELATLLATYDQYMDEAILSDIETLINSNGLDRQKDTLLGCGSAWGAYNKNDLFIKGHGAEGSDIVTPESRDQMLDLCQELSQGGGGSSGGGKGGSGAGGFSGITGLDSFQCADAGKSSSGGYDPIEQAEKMIEVFMEECEDSLVPTEGEDTPEDTSPTPDQGGDNEDENENENKVKSKNTRTRENNDNTTTIITTTEYEDGTTVIEEVTKNANGDVIKTKVITKSAPDEKGTVRTDVITTYPDGKQTRVQSDRYRNGTIRAWMGYYFKGEYTDEWRWTKDRKGNIVELGRRYRDSEGFPYWYYWTPNSNCLDSACEDCRDYASLLPEIFGECVNSVGASYPCKAAASAADCCESMLGDPRTITPDPDGNYQCGGEIGDDARRAACESKCGVAENEDCQSQCESFEGLKGIKFNVLNSICRYAISEECVSSGAVIQFPFKGKTLKNGGKPPTTTTGDIAGSHLPPSIEKHIPFSEYNLGEPLGVLLPKGKGYSAVVGQLQEEVVKSSSPSVRLSSLELLAECIGPDAIPIITATLRDADVDVRIKAAELLLAFGDKSGMQALHQSLTTLAPESGQSDFNTIELAQGELDREHTERDVQLQDALRVAEALSEMGDPSGLEFVTYMALVGEQRVLRIRAIGILINLAMQDNSVPSGLIVDPVSVLMSVAEQETDVIVLRALEKYAAKLQHTTSREIYEKLANVPYKDQKQRI